jgi:hypothetical protein
MLKAPEAVAAAVVELLRRDDFETGYRLELGR